jgi:hypothetical protein
LPTRSFETLRARSKKHLGEVDNLTPGETPRPLMEKHMYRTSSKLIAATLLSATIGGTAFAQGTMAQQDACRSDVFRLCSSYIPDVGQIVACLRGNEPQLSEACHSVMFEQQAAASRQYSTPSRLRAEWNR